MEENILQVPYSSQWDPDARGTNNDCGPASIKMVLNFFGEDLTTDQIFKATGAGPNLIKISELIKAINSFGYNAAYETNSTPQRIRDLIDQGIPVIPLVHYGSLGPTRQDQKYQSGHFFTVVGYRKDGYFVNDPNFYDKFRGDGDHHFYPKEDFEKAWADCFLDQNPVNSLLIIWPRLEDKKDYVVTPHQRNVVVTADNGLNVRTDPSTVGKNIKKTFAKGTSFAVEGYVVGENVANINLWWKLKGEDIFAWAGATNFVPKATDEPGVSDEVPTTNMTRQELEARIDFLEKEELPRVVKNGLDKERAIDTLKEEKQKLLEKYSILEQKVGAELTLKKANEQLSLRIVTLVGEDGKSGKLGELKQQRDEAYIKAFEGWSLYEIPKGLSGIAKSPIFILRLIGLAFSSVKSDFVLGWKKDAKLYKDGTGPAFETTEKPVDATG